MSQRRVVGMGSGRTTPCSNLAKWRLSLTATFANAGAVFVQLAFARMGTRRAGSSKPRGRILSKGMACAQ